MVSTAMTLLWRFPKSWPNARRAATRSSSPPAASSLKLVSRGQYSVVRENKVDDDKEVDISVLADGVGRIPIEIKALGPYSLNALRACIGDQLYGRYMRPSEVHYGVLLVVRQGDKEWDIDGKPRASPPRPAQSPQTCTVRARWPRGRS